MENGDMFQAPSAARQRVPVRMTTGAAFCSPVGATENSPGQVTRARAAGRVTASREPIPQPISPCKGNPSSNLTRAFHHVFIT